MRGIYQQRETLGAFNTLFNDLLDDRELFLRYSRKCAFVCVCDASPLDI